MGRGVFILGSGAARRPWSQDGPARRGENGWSALVADPEGNGLTIHAAEAEGAADGVGVGGACGMSSEGAR